MCKGESHDRQRRVEGSSRGRREESQEEQGQEGQGREKERQRGKVISAKHRESVVLKH
jgi:hypothetical protein